METMRSRAIHVVGSCRCGGIQLEITAAPLLTMACHCVGCQKMTASAFSLSAAIPTQGFRVTSGEPVIGGLHGTERHYFCPFCLSWLFTKPAGIDVFVNVRSTMLMERSEEHTSELQSLMRISYAVFCLKKKNKTD